MISIHPRIDPPGGTAVLAGRSVARIGYGAMQLPGPQVLGPPRDRATALAVLRRAIELGVNHPEIELQLLGRFTRSLAALWQNAATPDRELVT